MVLCPTDVMPRFTVVAHDHPYDHWDLFLEAGPVLRTWRLVPRLEPDIPTTVEPTPDHRLHYLDYEGPLSGGRGNVARVDAGTFNWESDEPDRIVVELAGTFLVGRLTLSRSNGGWSASFDRVL